MSEIMHTPVPLLIIFIIAGAGMSLTCAVKLLRERHARKVTGMPRRHPEWISGSDRAARRSRFAELRAELWPHAEWAEEIERHHRWSA
jgi:hypothetical protein